MQPFVHCRLTWIGMTGLLVGILLVTALQPGSEPVRFNSLGISHYSDPPNPISAPWHRPIPDRPIN